MKKSISIVLLLCMLVTLFSGMSFAIDEPQQPEQTAAVEEIAPEAEAAETDAEAVPEIEEAAAEEAGDVTMALVDGKLQVTEGEMVTNVFLTAEGELGVDLVVFVMYFVRAE